MKKRITLFALPAILLLNGCGGGGSTPAPAATADSAVMQVVDGLNANKADAPWHMLPASYQAELHAVKDTFTSKMDAELYDAGAGVVSKLASVLAAKKDLLLASPMTKGIPMGTDLSANYDQLVAILSTLAASDAATLEGLKNAEIGNLLANAGSDMMKTISTMKISRESKKPMGMNRMLKAPAKVLAMKAELVSENGDNAVVKLSTEGETPKELPFVNVEGKWIPKEMAEEFPEGLAEMKKSVEAMEITAQQKAQAMMGITMINGVLDQINAAKTQEELQAALGGLMGMAMQGM